MEHNDELNSFPSLSKMSRKEPFEAPDGYFDQLSSKIQDRISSEKKSLVPVFRLRPIAIIASLIVILIVSGTFIYLHQNNNDKTELAITYDDVLESGYYLEIDEATLCESIPPATATITNDKSIDEYLINNADESLISNSLRNN